MKTKSLLTFVISSVLLVTVAITFNFKSERCYQPRNTSQFEEKTQGISGAIEWLNRRRVNPATGKVDINDIMKVQNALAAFRQSNKLKNSLGLNWIEMGPNNVGGRTRAILVDNQNDNLIFAGGVGGGLWKTTTNGTSWSKVSGSDSWSNINICSICQTINGDIYVGTGEGFYYNSGTGTGGFEGEGIWKSTDRGNTFSRLEATWPNFLTQVTSLANLDTLYTEEIDSLIALQDTLLNDQIADLTYIRDSIVNRKDSLVNFETNTKAAFFNVNKLAADPDDANTVYAATAKGLLVTYDGGTTWENTIISKYYQHNLQYFEAVSTDVKVASDGSVIASVNNTPFLSDGKLYNVEIDSITKSTEDIMLITGNSGTVIKSINSGNNWANINSGISTNFVSFAPAGNSSGIAIGSLGKIYKTTDNGNNWSSVPSNIISNLECITFVSSKVGHIVGANGTILKSDTYGNSWSISTSGTTNDLHGVGFGNTSSTLSKGFVVGDKGTIKKTTNGGGTWANSNSGTIKNLRSVYCLNSTTAFAVGDSGTMIKTLNANTTATWNQINLIDSLGPSFNSTLTLNKIYFSNNTTGFVVGDKGIILKTVNSGTDWTIINSGTINDLNSIFFENDSLGYIVGDKGTVLKTVDAGNVWSSINVGTTNNLYSFYTNDFIKVKTVNTNSISIGDIVSLIVDTSYYNSVGTVYGITINNELLIDIPFTVDTIVNLGIITNFFNLETRGSLSPNSGRLEFAFAPSDPNYIYCSSAKLNGALDNIYQTKNKGLTWDVIAPGDNPLFDPFGSNNQGTYDNVIAVYPDNKDNALMGGIDVWKKLGAKFFEQITLWNGYGAGYYVHADIHTIVFHPKYNTNKTLYIGCDGGVFKSTDGGATFAEINKNYNVTQFYSVSAGPTGSVAGGCQDNGSQMINFKGNTYQSALGVGGGDGGYTHFSTLDPKILYTSVYYGAVNRSQDGGYSMSGYTEGDKQNGNFVTPFRISENFYDTLSIDSVEAEFKNNTNQVIPKYAADTIIDIIGESVINARPLYHKYKLTTKLQPGQKITVNVQDYYQAFFVLGRNNKLSVSRSPLNFASPEGAVDCPAGISGQVETLEFSKDGNILYIATPNSVYRIDSLYKFRTVPEIMAMQADRIGIFGSQTITSLAVDPQNSENLVVTLGNYGSDNHVYYSTNAATCPTSTGLNNFKLVQGDLPAMPVYSSLILWNDSKTVIIGTEYGVFSTSDITDTTLVTWTEETSFPNVATFMLTQQTFENTWEHGVYNHGYIYAATHGRGIWRSESNKGPVAVPIISKRDENIKIHVFPNPTSDNANIDIALSNSSNGTLTVYDINGRLVKKLDLELNSGSNKISFNVADLQKGTYFVSLKTEMKQYSTKMIVL